MKKSLFLVCIIFSIASLSFSAETLMDGLEDTAYTPTTATGESLTFASSSDKTEGAKSLEVTYNFVAADAWYNSANFEKTLSSPLDISSMDYISFDLNVSTANSSFLLLIYFVDEKGYVVRIVQYTPFDSATTGFKTFNTKLSSVEKTQWVGAGRAINLKKVAKIRYSIQRDANPGTGTFIFKIDNLKFTSGAGLVQEVVLEDFESYADDAALQAKWITGFGGTNRTLITSGAYTGSKCMNINMDVAGNWTNYAAVYTYTTPQDFSTTRYFRMAVYGDTKVATYTAIAHLYLEDNGGNRILAYAWLWPENAEWSEIFLPFNADGIEAWTAESTLQWGGSSCWRQDKWDAAPGWSANCDLTQIKKLILSFETGTASGPSNPYPVNNVNIKFDKITAGYVTNDPPTPSVKNYNVNALMTGSITINGVVGAGEWDVAATPGCTGFVQHNANTVAATEDPTVKALFDNTYLYILYQVTNNNFALDFTPSGSGRDPLGSTYTGDDFEFFIASLGNMDAFCYRIVFFPYQGDGKCYVWDGAGASSSSDPALWNATGDQAAFAYNSSTKLLTIEYKVPFLSFNDPSAKVTTYPTNGTRWGIQIGYINNSPAEAVNWEPDGTAGFYAGRPLGTWIFTGTPPAPQSAKKWNLYE